MYSGVLIKSNYAIVKLKQKEKGKIDVLWAERLSFVTWIDG